MASLVLNGVALALLYQNASSLSSSLSFSILAYTTSMYLIPNLAPHLAAKGFYGKDMLKAYTTKIPETLGAVVAFVYLLAMFLFLPVPFYRYIISTTGGGTRIGITEQEGDYQIPHTKLGEYLAALLSLQAMIILGFADDLFDIRWRHKFFLPGIASIPLLMVYYVDFNVTNVIVPIQLRTWLGNSYDLGFLYYFYMFSFSIFCTNAINIMAGINGIEVAQSLVIAIFVVINDILYLIPDHHPAQQSHLFSIFFLLPFIGVSIALLRFNWCPAKVFVGDTYCYFAGMLFAVVGILGHFSKTMLLFFIPQIINFILSVPQLFYMVPCPRHRLPKYNALTGKLTPSYCEIHNVHPLVAEVLKIAALFKIVDIEYDKEGNAIKCSNLTLINAFLTFFGPMKEWQLTSSICFFQIICGCIALVLRHKFAMLVYTEDN